MIYLLMIRIPRKVASPNCIHGSALEFVFIDFGLKPDFLPCPSTRTKIN